jgi:group I intron endonuclease
MENKYTIYKITCLVNNKIYIGYTKNTPEKRLKQHFRAAKGKAAINNKFAKAILKYKKDNFNIESIFTCYTKEKALQKEIELISRYNSIKEGYNTKIGGDAGATNNKRDVSGCKNPMFGKTNKHTPEIKYQISQSVINFNKSNSESALIANKNRRNKLIEMNKTIFNQLNKKPILQIDVKTNKIMREWPSSKDAGNYLGIFPTSITKVCKGKNNSAGGFKWSYK